MFLNAVLQPRKGTPSRFGLFPVRSPLLRESFVYFLFLRLLRCFSSAGWPLFRDNTPSAYWVVPFGDPGMLYSCAVPPGLSQLTTSFFASQSLGIHHAPLLCFKSFRFIYTIFCENCIYPTTLIDFRPPKLILVMQKNYHCDLG